MAARILNIPIRKIVDSPFQGRFFDAGNFKNQHDKKLFDELTKSIETSGLMQPIIVRQVGDLYEVVDGHRRIAAYKQLGKGNIPAIVKDASDKDIQIMSVVANLQRSNLSNLEKAMAFEKILKTGVFQSRKELSKAIGKDETYVGDIMNLLKLDSRILEHLATHSHSSDVRLLRIIRKAGKINEKGLSEAQYKLYLRYIHQKLSREQLQREVDKSVKTSVTGKIALKSSQKGFSLQLHDKLSKAQKEYLRKLLEVKMQEVVDEVLNSGKI